MQIPDELVFHILSYSSVRSLLRFRCVCKKWRSMISDDPSFVDLHLSRSRSALLVSVPDMRSPNRRCTLVSLKDGEATRLPLPPLSHRNISESVNGLVCIYEEGGFYLYSKPSPALLVYNPSTREHVALTPTTAVSDPAFCFQRISLGFDTSTSTYKTLRVWMNGRGCKCEIFTLGSGGGGGGAWRIIKDVPITIDPLAKKGVCHDGTIYWAASRGIRNFMTAFDVGEEKFRDIPVPSVARPWRGRTWNMIVMDGRIAIVDFEDVAKYGGDVMMMWKLEDPINGVWSENRIVVPEYCLPSRVLYSSPFSITSIDSHITLIPSWLSTEWDVVHNLKEEEEEEDKEERPRLEVAAASNDWDGFFPYVDCRGDLSVYRESLISLKEICRL